MSEDWAYLSELPKEIEGFSLAVGNEGELFSYVNEEKRRRAVFFQTEDGKAYMLRCYAGLNVFNDARFIARSREAFEGILREDMVKRVSDMARGAYGYVLETTGILKWDHSGFLPDKAAGFELFIKPDAPLAIINGSYVIVDYSDFDKGAQFIIIYNELKDEFYAEKIIKGTVETTPLFDAKKLKELGMKLEGLDVYLQEFRKQIEK